MCTEQDTKCIRCRNTVTIVTKCDSVKEKENEDPKEGVDYRECKDFKFLESLKVRSGQATKSVQEYRYLKHCFTDDSDRACHCFQSSQT